MGATAFNRMRRIAADSMGKPFEEVGYSEAVKHLFPQNPEEKTTSEEEPPIPEEREFEKSLDPTEYSENIQSSDDDEEPATAIIPPALVLINKAANVDELTPLPTVGTASATAILEKRPEGGYESIEAIAVLNPNLRCDWDAIEAYQP